MKASDLFVKCLETENIEYVFGIPGEENADLMMSLEASESITFVLTRHEQGAAFMADVYGRLTGNPAVCISTLGPGATNLITGVANANMDHAPLLVVTGQGATTRLHKESHQIIDTVAMFRPVTKWACDILHPDNIPEMIRKAVRLARSEKPGACHLDFAENLAKLDTNMSPLEPHLYRRPIASHRIIESACERILAAKSPIILAGNGCFRKRASQQLRRFCETTGIGVLNTFMAKGCVDADADYCLYTIGLGTKDIPAFALDEADLVVTIGYDMVEYHPRLWNSAHSKPIVHIDFLPAEIDACYHPEIEVVGDLGDNLSVLNQFVLKKEKPSFDLSFQRQTRQHMQTEFKQHQDDTTQGAIKPQKVLWDIQQCLNKEDIVLSDVGAHKMWIGRNFQCHQPNTCLIPNGFCSMGFALPGAIAASLVHPNRNVVAISGDAGFLMNVQEMETARRLNCNIVVIIWVDNAYGLIAWKQESEFGTHTDLSFENPNWLLLAESFKWNAHWVENSQDISATLSKALTEHGPSLIALPIDYRENLKLTHYLEDLSK